MVTPCLPCFPLRVARLSKLAARHFGLEIKIPHALLSHARANWRTTAGLPANNFTLPDVLHVTERYYWKEMTKDVYRPSVISQIFGGNIYLLAGLKKYHSNQLEKVNMITSRVNTVCAFLCWYTSFIQFIWSMQQVAAEHQLVQQLLPLQTTTQKKK